MTACRVTTLLEFTVEHGTAVGEAVVGAELVTKRVDHDLALERGNVIEFRRRHYVVASVARTLVENPSDFSTLVQHVLLVRRDD